MATPIKIALTHVRCLEETDEGGSASDEIYVLVTAVNLKSAVPQVEVTKYGPWGSVDEGELKSTMPIQPGVNPDTLPSIIWRRPCWGLNGQAAVINHPDDVILMVSVMEHDDGNTGAARTIVKSAATATMASSMGMSRADRVTKLRRDINGALELPTGAPNFDDRVGTKELRLSADLLQVENGAKEKKIEFAGDGGQYRVRFELRKG